MKGLLVGLMAERKNRSSEKYHMSQTILGALFSVTLVLGTSGVGLTNSPLQVYAQEVSTSEICDNFVDDDEDGFMDAEDPESCSPATEQGQVEGGAVPPPETITQVEICDNFVDDDGDSFADFDDPEGCSPATEQGQVEGGAVPPPETITQVEICDNFVDDDGDSFADFDDPEGCSPMSVEGNMTAAENMTGEPAVPIPENMTAAENMTGEPAVPISENMTAAENMTGEPAVPISENMTAAENMTGEPAVPISENMTAAENMTGEPAVPIPENMTAGGEELSALGGTTLSAASACSVSITGGTATMFSGEFASLRADVTGATPQKFQWKVENQGRIIKDYDDTVYRSTLESPVQPPTLMSSPDFIRQNLAFFWQIDPKDPVRTITVTVTASGGGTCTNSKDFTVVLGRYR